MHSRHGCVTPRACCATSCRSHAEHLVPTNPKLCYMVRACSTVGAQRCFVLQFLLRVSCVRVLSWHWVPLYDADAGGPGLCRGGGTRLRASMMYGPAKARPRYYSLLGFGKALLQIVPAHYYKAPNLLCCGCFRAVPFQGRALTNQCRLKAKGVRAFYLIRSRKRRDIAALYARF